VDDLENHPMTRMSPRRSHRLRIAMAVTIAMLTAGCASSPEAGPTELNSKVDAGTTAPSPRPLLYLQGTVANSDWAEVAIYADGRVIWPIGDGDPGYLQMRLTPEALERLRSRAVSTGLFEQDQGLTIDHRAGSMEGRLRSGARAVSTGLFEQDQELTLDHRHGNMEVRRDDRSVIVVWGEDPSAIRLSGKALVARDLEWIAPATAEEEIELIELVAFFRDPTEWRLPSSSYVQPESSPFVPSRIRVVHDGGEPDWSTLPSPAREIVGKRLEEQEQRGDACQVVSTDQARQIARALTQAGIHADYDSQRGMLGFQAAGSFVHSSPALPHEVAC
jgi:hypothetical protein